MISYNENQKKKTFQKIQLCKKCNPFASLKFSGEGDKMNPKRFIENFEQLALQENLDEFEKQQYFIRSLVEDAAIWMLRHGYGTYQEMKEAFLNFYWCLDSQELLLNNVIFGKYDKNCGLSMTQYFIKYIDDIMYLDEIPEEKDVVLELLRHFDLDQNIHKDIELVETIEEALDLLTNAENLENILTPDNFSESNNSSRSDSGIFNKIQDQCSCKELIDYKNQENENGSQDYEFFRKFNPFENFKFSGKADRIHPKRFVENFEFFAAKGNLDDYEKQYYFTQFLVGDAENWMNAHAFESYEEMKNAFLEFYWSSDIQESFLNHLENGKYDESCGLSMTDYFFKYFNEAKFVNKGPSEEHVIAKLLKHFKLENITGFELQSIRTAEEALDTITKAEALDNSNCKGFSAKFSNFWKSKSKTWRVMFNSTIFVLLVIFLAIIFYGFMQTQAKNQLVSYQKQLCKDTFPEIRIYRNINPFKNLKFSGRINGMHPKRFIQNFEYFAAHENLNEYEKQYYFIQSLVEDAQNWLNAHGYGSYKEMKEDFINFYWNEDIQRTFLNHLMNGKYNKNCGLSMNDYFFKYANEAKFLNEALTEEAVILNLLYHFDLQEEIKDLLETTSVKTIQEASNILRKAEALKIDKILNRQSKSDFWTNIFNFLSGLYSALFYSIISFVRKC